MRLRSCRRCGASYQTDRPDTYLCPVCHKAVKVAGVVRPRVCRQCGATFSGGPRAWYCPDCRLDRRREADARHKRNGTVRPIGSMDTCAQCGSAYTVNGARQKYCPACADSAVKAVVRPMKAAYNAAHKDDIAAYKLAMQRDRKICVICGEVFDNGRPTVTCSPACAAEQRKRNQKRADDKRSGRRRRKTEESGEQ